MLASATLFQPRDTFLPNDENTHSLRPGSQAGAQPEPEAQQKEVCGPPSGKLTVTVQTGSTWVKGEFEWLITEECQLSMPCIFQGGKIQFEKCSCNRGGGLWTCETKSSVSRPGEAAVLGDTFSTTLREVNDGGQRVFKLDEQWTGGVSITGSPYVSDPSKVFTDTLYEYPFYCSDPACTDRSA
ncbi:MAG: hypothetical protein M1833_005732 [Piccolia ochrophora]|nr:MAG: hypothetical protein M1833_005732 [Piccolia ochrophora]